MDFKKLRKKRRTNLAKSAQSTGSTQDNAKSRGAAKMTAGSGAPESRTAELLSLSEIAARTKINRNAVARKLRHYEIAPAVDTPNKKLFEYTEALEDALHSDDEDPRIRAAQLANLKLRNEIKRLDLEIASGRRVHVSKIEQLAEKIFGTIIKKSRRLPDHLALKLHGSRSAKELERELRREIYRIFADARRENPEYLK